MGKSSRERKDRKSKKTMTKPDDYVRYGPIELARFGKTIVTRNNMSQDEFEQYQTSIAKRHPEICAKIDSKIREITKIVSTLPPLDLLKQAHWKFVGTSIGLYGDVRDGNTALALRMIDYVQSIVASTLPAETVEESVDEETYGTLEKLVENLFSNLAFYFTSRTLYEKETNPDYDKEYDKFYTLAQMHWCMVRGKRYHAHEIEHHTAILSPHNEILQEIFGVTVSELMEGVKSILGSMTSGIPDCAEDLEKFRKATMTALEEHLKSAPRSGSDIREVMQDVIKLNGWEAWQDNIVGRFSGYDLYDLQKITNLPTAFLEAFSWGQGEETEFLSGEDMRGWPLKVWPVFQRPFFKHEGKYYIFECHSLLDNLYRQIQRAIFIKRPDYKPIWATKQQEISERLPVEYFERILPGAKVYQSVFYPLATKNDWAECDIVICYEDHIFIIEVKAGSFTYTSPATDFPAYIASLKSLVYKPAEQGTRFLKYLRSNPTVTLYDKDHKENGTLSADDYYQCNICALTLDSFTEIACQPEQLKKLRIDVGDHPIWAFSIDDLRVYADVFSNPLVFLHYAEQRSRAFNTAHMMLNDEMDHLGLYLAHNAYAIRPLNMPDADRIRYHGFSSNIDDYYSQRLTDPNAPCRLKQEMPKRLDEIIDALLKKTIPGRRKAASMLLDCGGEWRNNIASSIDQVLKQQRTRGTIRPISTIGETKVNIVCWDQKVSMVQKGFAHDHCYATMLIAEDDERTLLELFYNEELELIDISFDHLRRKDIPSGEVARLKSLSADIMAQRLERSSQSGKVGRNQLCPCGSGMKYKKCCGR